MPLLKGRNFNEQDRIETPLMTVINQTMARRYWPGEDPIGKQIQLPDPKQDATIIGIVGDVKQFSLDETAAPQIYLAYEQQPYLFATLAVRTTTDAANFSNAVRNAIWTVDADQPVWKVRTLEFLYQRSLAPQRFQMKLLLIFSILALTLAAVGIYGVMSHAVSQRTQEIGIRLALGARGEDILRLVIGQGMMLGLLGAALGLLLSFAASQMMAGLLFNVTPVDPVTFTLVPLVLLLVALLACYLPARRASKVDPMAALR
jgi:predicted permease